MIIQQVKDRLEALTVRCTDPVVELFNDFLNLNRGDVCNQDYEDIAKLVSPEAIRLQRPLVNGGYHFFAGILTRIKGFDISTLVPWRIAPSGEIERSAEIYSSAELPRDIVSDILERVSLGYLSVLNVQNAIPPMSICVDWSSMLFPGYAEKRRAKIRRAV